MGPLSGRDPHRGLTRSRMAPADALARRRQTAHRGGAPPPRGRDALDLQRLGAWNLRTADLRARSLSSGRQRHRPTLTRSVEGPRHRPLRPERPGTSLAATRRRMPSDRGGHYARPGRLDRSWGRLDHPVRRAAPHHAAAPQNDPVLRRLTRRRKVLERFEGQLLLGPIPGRVQPPQRGRLRLRHRLRH